MDERIHSIDSLRAIAIFFVVVAHTFPFEGYGSNGDQIYFILDTIGQFDLPIFFMASGFFFAMKVNADNVKSYTASATRKLGSMYLFGLLLFFPLLVLSRIGHSLAFGLNLEAELFSLFSRSFTIPGLFYYGNSILPPLWFLTALIYSLCIVAVFVKFDKTHYLLPVVTVLHAIGIISQNFPFIFELPVQTEDALFFGLFYIVLGFTIYRSNWRPNQDQSRLYLSLVFTLFLIQLIEQFSIGSITSYTISTVFLALAIFAYGLSNPRFGKGTVLPLLGRYAVGVYLLHFPIIKIFETFNTFLTAFVGIDLTNYLLWHLTLTPLVYVLSLSVYILLARIGVVDMDGSHIPRLSRIRAHLSTPKNIGR